MVKLKPLQKSWRSNYKKKYPDKWLRQQWAGASSSK